MIPPKKHLLKHQPVITQIALMVRVRTYVQCVRETRIMYICYVCVYVSMYLRTLCKKFIVFVIFDSFIKLGRVLAVLPSYSTGLTAKDAS